MGGTVTPWSAKPIKLVRLQHRAPIFMNSYLVTYLDPTTAMKAGDRVRIQRLSSRYEHNFAATFTGLLAIDLVKGRPIWCKGDNNKVFVSSQIQMISRGDYSTTVQTVNSVYKITYETKPPQ